MGIYVFGLLILAGVVLGWLYVKGKKMRLNEALAAYREALDELKQSPTDPDRRQQALRLGRAYADITRESKNATVYDEMAIKNDIDAVCAGAAEVAAARAGGSASAAAEIRKLTELLEEGILTPEEWQSAKRQIVGLRQDQVDETVKLLRALHQLVSTGGLTESEYNLKKWDILSQKLISPDRPPVVPSKK